MKRQKEKATGSKGFEPKEARDLARCGGWGKAAAPSPSSSDCNRVGTWNVRSLYKAGKLAGVMKEMKRMKIGIMGVAETCWDKEGTFTTQLPEKVGGDKFKVFFSGGVKKRRGVGVIVKEEVGRSVMMCAPISERIIVMRLKMTPINMLTVQIYAPCEDDEDEEKERFYESLDQAIREFRKGRECLVVMGDFNGKVGNSKEEDTVGPYGLGERNDNGERVVNFCKRHNLCITNTWFQQKRSAQHTWTSPDKEIKNQIDYVMVDKRFRHGIQNSKSRPGADCESDHNPVVVTMKIKLQRVQKTRKTEKWNVSKLKRPEISHAYRSTLDKQLQEEKNLEGSKMPILKMWEEVEIRDKREIEETWNKLKERIEMVAEEICGKEQIMKKQNWMTSDILAKMEDRRKAKNLGDAGRYKKLKQEIQKLCREAKDKYYEDMCKEIEMLDRVHSHLLHKKIKEMRPKGNSFLQTIKNKQGKSLVEKDEVMERWAEYVEELYKDESRSVAYMGELREVGCSITSEEIAHVIKELPKGKACGIDNIPAELLQSMGEKGMEIMVKLINKIYNSGYIPEDFRKSIFIPVPKVSRAQECNDFRTIALISHASKILLHLIKRRIAPIIERQLADSQMGFRKGKGTRDAIFQLRMITERVTQMNMEVLYQGKKRLKGRKVYLCFVDYQKAFDRVKHSKLLVVMEKAGVPILERRLIINLYWGQPAAVKWDGEIGRDVSVERGVRQGCVISPLLFNLYSEFMINEAMETVEGIGFNGVNITNLRFADDAVLITDKRKKLQKMINRLNETCKDYGMEVNVKKTKVMVLGSTEEQGKKQRAVRLGVVPLEQVTRFKYLGSWITDDAKSEVDIRAKIGLAKAAFWQNKELMRRNIRFSTKIKILNCYVFSILNYGCECWTWNKAMRLKVNAFEMWCYRRILRISWKDKVTNKEVLNRVQIELHFLKDMIKRKLKYAGHVLRGSSGATHLQILEGRIEGKRKVGAPRSTWMKDVCGWTGMDSYGKVKREAENRESWKFMVVNLHIEVDR